MKKYWPFLLVLAILVLDQIFKLWVYFNFQLGQERHIIGDWFRLHYTENNGMAFGLEWGGRTGKLLLTLFRVMAAAGFIWYLVYLIKKEAHSGLLTCVALVLAGATGNIVDSLFYGLLFGYESFGFGRVIDMLYFPIYQGFLPDWLPFIGGDYFVFFQPVFNLADSSITVGVLLFLVFQKRFLSAGS